MDYASFLCIIFWSQYAAAVIFNLLLFLIIYHRGSRNGYFRYFHYFCIIMALNNFGTACVVPHTFFHNGLICWIPLAPWNNIAILMKISFMLWLSGFEWTLIAVTTGFVFRYALICRLDSHYDKLCENS